MSKFARSGVTAVSDFVNYGFMESEADLAERLKVPLEDSCHVAGRRPHIIMIHDESSFDIRRADGVKVWALWSSAEDRELRVAIPDDAEVFGALGNRLDEKDNVVLTPRPHPALAGTVKYVLISD